MTEEPKRFAIDDFLDEVKAHHDDRGYLARLKRGLAEGTEDQAWGILAVQHFNFSDVVKRKVWTTIGGLAATLMDAGLLKTEGWENMGTVMRRIIHADGKADESRVKTYETKLRRLLNCTSTIELCDLVIGIVRLAEAKGVAVNCRQLYFDLNSWDDPKKRENSRVHWAQDFYRVEQEQDGQMSESNGKGSAE